MIYYLNKTDNETLENYKKQNPFIRTSTNDEEAFKELLEQWARMIDFIEQMKLKNLEALNNRTDIINAIKTEVKIILDFIYSTADKKTDEAFKKALNTISYIEALEIITEQKKEAAEKEINDLQYSGGYFWKFVEVADRLYYFTLTPYKDFLIYSLHTPEEQARNIIYSIIKEEVITRPYILPDIEENKYYHGPALDLLTSPGRSENGEIKTRRTDKQQIRIVKKETAVKKIQFAIPEEQIYKKIGLSENKVKIAIYLDMLLTQKVYGHQKQVKKKVDLTLNYEDFILKTQGLDRTKPGYRQYKARLKKDLKELAQISVEGKLKGIDYYRANLINDIVLTEQNTAHISLNKFFAIYLINSPMTAGFNLLSKKGSDFDILRKLIEYSSQDNNIKRGTNHKIKVKNVLKATSIIQYDRLDQKKKWRSRIKKKFETSLNNLVISRDLIYWYYLDNQGNRIEPENIKTYDEFENLYLIFDLVNKSHHQIDMENSVKYKLLEDHKNPEK